MDAEGECPVCDQKIAQEKLEAHVNICLFLREAAESPSTSKRKNFSIFQEPGQSKRIRQDVGKVDASVVIDCDLDGDEQPLSPRENGDGPKRKLTEAKENASGSASNIPLAERMRPDTLENFIGQTHVLNKNAILRHALEKHEIPSMILWGPPGCGKVSDFTHRVIMSLTPLPQLPFRPPWRTSSQAAARQRRTRGSSSCPPPCPE